MKYDIEQLLEAGEIIQIYPEGYSMYPMFVPGRDAAVIKKADVKREALPFFLSSDGLIDLTIPRGKTII